MINRTKVESVCRQVLDSVVPSQAEKDKTEAVINFARTSVQDELKKQKIDADVFLGGSMGKDTWLSGVHDIDFFIRFSTDYDEEELGELLGKIIKSVFPSAKVVHGSRDYYNVLHKGHVIEFVPVFKIDSPDKAKNSMDASPFHVKFVKNHSRINSMGDEIRLMKAFAKAQGVYGAESYISGISGYVSELLVIKYGSFYNLLEAFENLQPKIIIDIEKHYKDQNRIFKILPESKLRSPLIVIDPVLKTRNAAAALDYDAFSALLFAVRMFLRNPAKSFFEQRKKKIEAVEKLSKKRGTLLVTTQIKSHDEKKDIFFAKLKKCIEKVQDSLEKQGIEIYDSGFFSEKEVTVYLEISTLKMSKYMKHYGPPVWIQSENFDAFVEKHKELRTEDVRLVVDEKRKFIDVKKQVLSILKEELKNV